MKTMPKQRYENPIDYLQNVLDTWIEFCRHHPDFEQALMYILLENRRIKKENEKLYTKIFELEDKLNERNN